MHYKEFDALPLNEQIKVIAKDVIAQLELGDFTATRRTYLEYPDGRSFILDELPQDAELSQVLSGIKCHGCALGGFFIASLLNHDQITVSQANYGSANILVNNYLSSWFSNSDKTMIECAFEGFTYVPLRQIETYLEFSAWREPDPKVRLIAIAQSIIDHDGKVDLAHLIPASVETDRLS